MRSDFANNHSSDPYNARNCPAYSCSSFVVRPNVNPSPNEHITTSLIIASNSRTSKLRPASLSKYVNLELKSFNSLSATFSGGIGSTRPANQVSIGLILITIRKVITSFSIFKEVGISFLPSTSMSFRGL